MSQRRLAYNSLEEDFAENERIQKRQMKQKAKKLANMGTSGFKTTDRGKDWLTKTHSGANLEGPNACRYTPKLDYVKPVASGYTGYQKSPDDPQKKIKESARDSWVGEIPNYQTSQQKQRRILRDNLNRRQQTSSGVHYCPPIFTTASSDPKQAL